MNEAVQSMLEKYSIQDSGDAEHAMKEIIQEIALLGLHRANFFEKAAFYGGTALRILYGLPRYSEDLDFTLFQSEKNFSLKPYFSAVEKELESYGFKVEIESVTKSNQSTIESAFIKANTKIHILKVQDFKNFSEKIQWQSKLQIKFEVDIDPSTQFEYETKYLLAPTSFPVISLKLPDLFAGKIHALLFRKWKNRIKGRDFYDYIWYLKKGTPVRLKYLKEKSIQSGHAGPKDFQTVDDLKSALIKRFDAVDFEKAKNDILPFIPDSREIEIWSTDFFKQITEKIQVL
jgi:predicted nucleotidyltransferase component of viral defense system